MLSWKKSLFKNGSTVIQNAYFMIYCEYKTHAKQEVCRVPASCMEIVLLILHPALN